MKTKTKKADRPTYAEVTEQLENLRHKIRLVQATWRGESAHLELLNACEVSGMDTKEQRQLKAAILFNCASIDLGYVLQGQG